MLDQLKSLFGLDDDQAAAPRPAMDKNLAAAALMVHVIAADGEITPEEEHRLEQILRDHYSVTEAEALALSNAAKLAQSDAVDMYRFTSILKAEMEEHERLALIEDLWEMVYADGEIHEFEDNVVWRVAELIGIQSRERMVLKQRVLNRRGAGTSENGDAS
ncbi:MAG: TerB family tellurite resistance protein [Rhizobiaceae bacterium]|nr:TerB family tellurite resistance protein [Hyphomicrobiales bacterium]NRB30814.1 TerB family tellurite resistance protein [Rhizobiaceae bacterium]